MKRTRPDGLLVVEDVSRHPTEGMDNTCLFPEILVLDHLRSRLDGDQRIGLAQGEGNKQQTGAYALHCSSSAMTKHAGCRGVRPYRSKCRVSVRVHRRFIYGKAYSLSGQRRLRSAAYHPEEFHATILLHKRSRYRDDRVDRHGTTIFNPGPLPGA